jgi:hypothetical protein
MKTYLAAIAVVLGLSSFGHAQLWTMSNSYLPTGISGDGSTMVGQTTGGWFYWTQAGGPTVIGGVATGNAKVSDNGMRIGASVTGPPNQWAATGWTEMGIYDRNTTSWTPYGSHNFHSGVTASSGWGISGDGNTVLGQAYWNTTAPGTTAARVNPTIGNVPGGPPINLDQNTVNNGRVVASNFDGTVVGGFDRGSTPGAIWVNGVMELMTGVYNGNTVNLSQVSDISANGRWILGDGGSAAAFRPYLKDRTSGNTIFAPNPWGTERATMASISDDGRYAFGRYLPLGGNPFTQAHLFVWDTQLNSVTLLNTIAAQNGINLNGLNLTLPGGMSADGHTFTGMGAGATATQTFVMRVDVVPEPATIAGLMAGTLAIVGRRRRRKFSN